MKKIKGIKGNKGGKGEKGIKSLEGQLVSRQREDAMRTRGIQKAASIDVKKPRKLGSIYKSSRLLFSCVSRLFDELSSQLFEEIPHAWKP